MTIKGEKMGLKSALITKEYAYKMGLDRAKNGSNLTNCHFSIFSSPENTKEWERGESDGKKLLKEKKWNTN